MQVYKGESSALNEMQNERLCCIEMVLDLWTTYRECASSEISMCSSDDVCMGHSLLSAEVVAVGPTYRRQQSQQYAVDIVER